MSMLAALPTNMLPDSSITPSPDKSHMAAGSLLAADETPRKYAKLDIIQPKTAGISHFQLLRR